MHRRCPDVPDEIFGLTVHEVEALAGTSSCKSRGQPVASQHFWSVNADLLLPILIEKAGGWRPEAGGEELHRL